MSVDNSVRQVDCTSKMADNLSMIRQFILLHGTPWKQISSEIRVTVKKSYNVSGFFPWVKLPYGAAVCIGFIATGNGMSCLNSLNILNEKLVATIVSKTCVTHSTTWLTSVGVVSFKVYVTINSLRWCHRYAFMDSKIRENLHSLFEESSLKFGLKNIKFQSFTAQCGFDQKVMLMVQHQSSQCCRQNVILGFQSLTCREKCNISE